MAGSTERDWGADRRARPLLEQPRRRYDRQPADVDSVDFDSSRKRARRARVDDRGRDDPDEREQHARKRQPFYAAHAGLPVAAEVIRRVRDSCLEAQGWTFY